MHKHIHGFSVFFDEIESCKPLFARIKKHTKNGAFSFAGSIRKAEAEAHIYFTVVQTRLVFVSVVLLLR